EFLRGRSAGAHQFRHSPPAGAADGERPAQDRASQRAADVAAGHAGALLRRRARHGGQHLSRRPQRRAHAHAMVARPQRRLQPRRSNQLYLPSLMDPIYGFQSLNVEAQRRTSSSLLNWTRRLIAVVKGLKSFGRGSIRFIRPPNRKVLVHLREHQGETVLCIANLSRNAQPVELDLQEFAGRRPVELMGRSQFPPIGTLPYFITLPPYGFFWFLLADSSGLVEEVPTVTPDLVTLVIPAGWHSLASGVVLQTLERHILPGWLMAQRWYRDKGRPAPSLSILAMAP